MTLPDVDHFGLDAETLVESASAQRIVLWSAERRDKDGTLWRRYVTIDESPQPPIESLHHGAQIDLASASEAVLHEPSVTWWQRLRGRPGGGRDSETALQTPSGGYAEPTVGQRARAMLIWSRDRTLPVSDEQASLQCPHAESQVRLGVNLVAAILFEDAVDEILDAASTSRENVANELQRPENDPLYLAERAIESATARSDRRAQIAAAIDRSAALTRRGLPDQAVGPLHDALAAARELGDELLELDASLDLGAALVELGQGDEAREALEPALRLAQNRGDRYAEKMALSQLGSAAMRVGLPQHAQAAYEAARRLAVELGDLRDEADVAWRLAVALEQSGRRRQAEHIAQRAVNLMRELALPEAATYGEHLDAFRRESAVLPETSEAHPSSPRPGVLRMAYTASRALLRFAASGMQTSPPDVREARLAICRDCEHHTGVRCRLCGCFTAQKTWLPHERCPKDKWPS
ncbi:MAG: tetratricopeptide repeat protein [Planctomycetales bacterium]|nr:tetratricopeptide repeat protein [Planctomycetales bacterium]